MTRTVEFNSTVKSGLPCLVWARIFPAEPDVGIFGKQVEAEIMWLTGKPMNIDIPRSDIERIEMECLERIEE